MGSLELVFSTEVDIYMILCDRLDLLTDRFLKTERILANIMFLVTSELILALLVLFIRALTFNLKFYELSFLFIIYEFYVFTLINVFVAKSWGWGG